MQCCQVPRGESWPFHYCDISIPICGHVWGLGPWHLLASMHKHPHYSWKEVFFSGHLKVFIFFTLISFEMFNLSLHPPNLQNMELTEAWRYHGDDVWGTLFNNDDVYIFNLCGFNLQRVLLGSLWTLWEVCLCLSWSILQVCMHLFFHFCMYALGKSFSLKRQFMYAHENAEKK